MIEKIILIGVSICLFAMTIKKTISDYLFVLHKKEAVAHIINVTLPDPQYTAGGGVYYNGMPGDGKASDWADIHNCIEVPLLDPGPFQSYQGQTQGWYSCVDPYSGDKYQEYRQ